MQTSSGSFLTSSSEEELIAKVIEDMGEEVAQVIPTEVPADLSTGENEKPISMYSFELPLEPDLEPGDAKLGSNLPAPRAQRIRRNALSNTWKCEASGDTTNLWINLSDGYVGGGRKQWDGSGGSNGAVDHYDLMKREHGKNYPLVAKIGTIHKDRNGRLTADVYSYAPEEDCEVTDIELHEHLVRLGFPEDHDFVKSEKTVDELNREMNLKYSFKDTYKAPGILVTKAEPGLIGIRNLGNTCYVSSTVRLLLSTELKVKYSDTDGANRRNIAKQIVSMSKALSRSDSVGSQSPKEGIAKEGHAGGPVSAGELSSPQASHPPKRPGSAQGVIDKYWQILELYKMVAHNDDVSLNEVKSHLNEPNRAKDEPMREKQEVSSPSSGKSSHSTSGHSAASPTAKSARLSPALSPSGAKERGQVEMGVQGEIAGQGKSGRGILEGEKLSPSSKISSSIKDTCTSINPGSFLGAFSFDRIRNTNSGGARGSSPGAASSTKGKQQDALEYLTCFLEALEDAERAFFISPLSTEDLFKIELTDRLEVIGRFKERTRNETFLSLPIKAESELDARDSSSYARDSSSYARDPSAYVSSPKAGASPKAITSSPKNFTSPRSINASSPKSGSGGRNLSLYDLLTEYFKPEVIHGYSVPKELAGLVPSTQSGSPASKSKQCDATRSTGFKRFPKYLLLSVGRYVMDYETMEPRKVERQISVDRNLDLSAFKSDKADSNTATGGNRVGFFQEVEDELLAMGFALEKVRTAISKIDFEGKNSVNVDNVLNEILATGADMMDDLSLGDAGLGALGGVSGSANLASHQVSQYALVGFVTHIGPTTNVGHYVANVLVNGKWVLFDDERVYHVKEETPANLGQAYIYLYKRADVPDFV